MNSPPAVRSALFFLAASTLALEGAAADTLTLRPTEVPGGETTYATLTLDRAPAVNTDFSIRLSGTNAAQAQPTIQVRAGQSRAEFKLTSAATANQAFVDVEVIDPRTRTGTAKARLVVTPAVLTTLTLDKSSVVGGTPGSTVTGTVALNGQAAAPGTTILLGQSCSNCQQSFQLDLPPSVQISTGARSASFTFEPRAFSSTKHFTILASQGSVVKSVALADNALRPQTISLSPATIAGAQQTTVTITLNAPAYSGYQLLLNCTASLTSDVPPGSRACSDLALFDPKALLLSVTAGQPSATFHLRNTQLTSLTQVTIKAAGIDTNGDAQATLTVAP